MSMTFYAHRETARGAEFSEGPHFSNANACMLLRSLGYGAEILDDYGEPGPLDARELRSRCLTALAVGGAIARRRHARDSKRQRRRVWATPGLLPPWAIAEDCARQRSVPRDEGVRGSSPRVGFRSRALMDECALRRAAGRLAKRDRRAANRMPQPALGEACSAFARVDAQLQG